MRVSRKNIRDCPDMCCGRVAKTIDSRSTRMGYRLRRRECKKCKKRWSTCEIRFEDAKRVKQLISALEIIGDATCK